MSGKYNNLYSDFWKGLRTHLRTLSPPFPLPSPPKGKQRGRYPLVWYNGRDFRVKLEASCSADNDWIFVQVAMMGDSKWERFAKVKSQIRSIQSMLRAAGIHDQLDWEPKPLNEDASRTND
jgi:hypothetical protein